MRSILSLRVGATPAPTRREPGAPALGYAFVRSGVDALRLPTAGAAFGLGTSLLVMIAATVLL
jgi:hypothetical protein